MTLLAPFHTKHPVILSFVLFTLSIPLVSAAPEGDEERVQQRPAIVIPAASRIAEIRSCLGNQASGPGRPIADRAAWAAASSRIASDKLIAEAGKISNQPTPQLPDDLFLMYSQKGSRMEYQQAFNQRRTRLSTLVWAECVEDKGRFLDAIARELESILSEKTWVLPAHDPRLENFKGTLVEVDLGAAARGWTLAIVDYWLGERLPADLRTRLRNELNRRLIAPYLAVLRGAPRSSGFGWITTSNNWNAVCHAGVIGTALALGLPADERAELIAAAEGNLPFYYSGFSAEGYCDEGIAYWNYGFGHCAMLAEIIATATGGHVQLLTGKKARLIAEYPNNLEIVPGVLPVFSDGGMAVQPSPFIRRLALRQIGAASPENSANKPKISVTQGLLSEIALEVFFTDLPDAAASQGARPLHHWFTEAQVLITRAPSSTFGAAIKASHNGESHNHNDIGSFVVAVDRTAPVIDPGGEIYTARTFSSGRYESKVLNSYGHNVPLVAGEMQGTGREYCARVVTAEFGEAADRLVLDLRAAYTVPTLVSLQRDFTLTRGTAPAVTVIDAVQFTSPQTFGTALMTFSPWREIKPGELLIGKGAGTVRVEFSGTGAPVRLRSETIDENLPEGGRPTRLGLEFTEPITSGSIRVRITPAPQP